MTSHNHLTYMYLTSPFSEQPYGTLTAVVIILYGFSSVHPHSHNSQQKTGSVQYWIGPVLDGSARRSSTVSVQYWIGPVLDRFSTGSVQYWIGSVLDGCARRSSSGAECAPTRAAPAPVSWCRTTRWRPEVETGRPRRGR